jgi:hypothetical protein
MMKIGDRLAVQIEGMDVGEAVIEDIEDGHATLVIPATRLVVQVRQTLDLTATAAPETDRVLAGVVDTQDNSSPATEALEQPQQVATPAPAAPVQQYNAPGSDIGEGIHGKELDSSAID